MEKYLNKLQKMELQAIELAGCMEVNLAWQLNLDLHL
jgi:hypothetical protein